MKAKDDVKRFTGDGLCVRVKSNDVILEVTGDGCRIDLVKNCGSVRIIGDGCHLNVEHNIGDIEYIGDGGRVVVGPDSCRERIKYTGCGGKVSCDERSQRRKIPRGELSASAPELQNLLNKCREADDKEPLNRGKKNRRERTVITTKVVSRDFTSDCVERWFTDPGSIVKFASDSATDL